MRTVSFGPSHGGDDRPENTAKNTPDPLEATAVVHWRRISRLTECDKLLGYMDDAAVLRVFCTPDGLKGAAPDAYEAFVDGIILADISPNAELLEAFNQQNKAEFYGNMIAGHPDGYFAHSPLTDVRSGSLTSSTNWRKTIGIGCKRLSSYAPGWIPEL